MVARYLRGLWLFTANDSFYPGTPFARRRPWRVPSARQLQLQAADVGGLRCDVLRRRPTTIDGIANNDRQSNTRVGATFALPVGRRHSIKLAVSRGAIVRFGANFSTFSFGWQTGWIPRPSPPGSPTLRRLVRASTSAAI